MIWCQLNFTRPVLQPRHSTPTSGVLSLQFRGEAFNISSTPHFSNPNADIASSNFALIGDVQYTGREGNDQRFFRLGVRIGF